MKEVIHILSGCPRLNVSCTVQIHPKKQILRNSKCYLIIQSWNNSTIIVRSTFPPNATTLWRSQWSQWEVCIKCIHGPWAVISIWPTTISCEAIFTTSSECKFKVSHFCCKMMGYRPSFAIIHSTQGSCVDAVSIKIVTNLILLLQPYFTSTCITLFD